MSTSYNAQIDNENGKYTIQFETSNYDYFKLVEKACQKAIDKRDKAIEKERSSMASTIGYVSL